MKLAPNGGWRTLHRRNPQSAKEGSPHLDRAEPIKLTQEFGAEEIGGIKPEAITAEETKPTITKYTLCGILHQGGASWLFVQAQDLDVSESEFLVIEQYREGDKDRHDREKVGDGNPQAPTAPGQARLF